MIGVFPLVLQGLREFKRLGGQVRRFVVAAIRDIKLELDGSQAITKLGCLASKGALIDLVGQTHGEQPVLLSDE